MASADFETIKKKKKKKETPTQESTLGSHADKQFYTKARTSRTLASNATKNGKKTLK